MKTGFLTEAVKILTFAVAIIITCILTWLGFQAADTARTISNSAVSQMAELNNDIQDSDILIYQDTEVNGSQVTNFIKKYLGDYEEDETAPIYVYVKTSMSEYTYRNNTYLTEIRNFTNERYIKPTAIFQSDVIRNENNVIIGATFSQK